MLHTLDTFGSLHRADSDEPARGPVMVKLLRSLGGVGLCAVVFAAPAAAQTAADQSASGAVCTRLQGQLSSLDRTASDPARAALIKHAEDAVAKQQADLDRTVAQSRRLGCQGIGGFFALFTGQSPQCAPLNSQIQQMRGNLDRMMSDLERLKIGSTDQEGQRRALIGQLAQNNCGPQYQAAAAQAGPGSFFDALFGGTIVNPGGDGAPSGTYRTVCVRTCDGFYFPISYSTVPSRFADDQRACQRLCPASEAQLYTYHNPGEDMSQAVSVDGRHYTELPNAFLYRREVIAGCSCRRAGQSWADALKNADDATTIERGDIVVTDEKAKALSQAPQQPPGKPPKANTTAPDTNANAPDANAAPAAPAAAPPPANATETDSSKRAVRTVGPPFLSGQ